RSVGREPRLADGVGRQSAGAAFGEDGLLKPGQHVLAKDGRERVFELAREERYLHFRIALPLDEVVEDEHLAEYRGRLGGRERRIVVEVALLAAERAVEPASQLGRDRHHVAQIMGGVAEDVRMQAGRRRGAGGGAARALADR